MYDPREQVSSYFWRKIRSVEGLLAAIFSVGYLAGFAFFSEVASFAGRHGFVMTSQHRAAFIVMPLLFLIVMLWMDSTAKLLADRILTIVVLIVCALVPVAHIMKIF